MLAFFDNSESKVVIIGERIYRISFEEFRQIKDSLELRGIVYVNMENMRNTISHSVASLSVLNNDTEHRYPKTTNTTNINKAIESEKEYISSVGGKCVVINGLDPKLQFMGIDDFKSVSHLRNTYGKIPEEVVNLIRDGRLVMIDESEKQKRIDIMKTKQKVKGRRIQQSTSRSERIAETGLDDNSGGDESDNDSSEDRMFKNAVKIDL